MGLWSQRTITLFRRQSGVSAVVAKPDGTPGVFASGAGEYPRVLLLTVAYDEVQGAQQLVCGHKKRPPYPLRIRWSSH